MFKIFLEINKTIGYSPFRFYAIDSRQLILIIFKYNKIPVVIIAFNGYWTNYIRVNKLYIILAWSNLVIIRIFFAFLGQTSITNVVMLPVHFPEVDIHNNNSEFIQALCTKVPYTIILKEFVLPDGIGLGLFQALSTNRINADGQYNNSSQ